MRRMPRPGAAGRHAAGAPAMRASRTAQSPGTPRPLDQVRAAIVQCARCPRLRAYCAQVGREPRAAFRGEVYWARPVPGFGDPQARLFLLGLAPAAHGANRTGRVFTGDGTGGSGDFLMAALHRAGFASQPTSTRADDGLRLADAYIAAAVRCAPPGNRPSPGEIAACLDHLDAETAALPRLQVVVALGRIAWDAWLRLLARRGLTARPKPAFAHGAVRVWRVPHPAHADVRGSTADGASGTLIGCYHPSRQNTNTGRVTPEMYDAIFRIARRLLADGSP